MSSAAHDQACSEDAAYRFGRDIAGFAAERAARLRATHSDPDVLAAEIHLQCEQPATRACTARLLHLKGAGMSIPVAEAWAEAAIRGYREGMAEGVAVH